MVKLDKVFKVCPVCGQVKPADKWQKVEFLIWYPELVYQLVIDAKARRINKEV